jgi:hypothetical protein
MIWLVAAMIVRLFERWAAAPLLRDRSCADDCALCLLWKTFNGQA